MATVQEGRKALDEVLLAETDRALEELLLGLAKAKRQIEETERSIANGQAIPTTVTGDAILIPENLNALATAYAAADRRRYRLLAAYDAVNGTEAE